MCLFVENEAIAKLKNLEEQIGKLELKNKEQIDQLRLENKELTDQLELKTKAQEVVIKELKAKLVRK